MANQFDIGTMFENVFGYKSTAFEFEQSEGKPQFANLGSPLYKKDANGREYFLPVKLGDYDLPYPIISMRTKKTFVETPMVECDGSVIELINLEGWQISIKGFAVNSKGNFPEDELSALNDLWVKKQSLQISNALTDIFLKGNQKVVITNFDIEANAGVEGVRPFSLELISDADLILELT